MKKKFGIDLPGKTSVSIVCANRILESGDLYNPNSVQDLRFLASSITDEDLKELAKLPELRSITANRSTITAQGLMYFRDHPHLETLGLDGSKMTDEGLALMDLPNLRSLSLGGTAISDAGVASLVRHSKLETLYLSHTKVTDACIDSFLKLPNLRVVAFDGTAITDVGLAKLKDHKNLKSLIVSEQIEKDTPAIMLLQQSLPGLTIHFR